MASQDRIVRVKPLPAPVRANVAALLVFLLMARGGVAGTPKGAAADNAAFQAVCGSCHKTSMIEGLRTESEWMEVIEQMVKLGAKGTDDQFDRVVRILLSTYTKVNINKASASEIAPVLDVSVETAENVVKWRDGKGSFVSLDQLKRVPGLDPAKLEERKNRIVF